MSLVEQSLVVASTDLMKPGRIRQHMRELEEPAEAIATPLPTWNEQSRDGAGGKGLALGWHVIVAAATGIGKTLMALNMAAEAIKVGEVVAFMSLEMSTAQVASRLYAILTGTDVRLIEHGTTPPPEVERKLCEIHESTGGRFLTNEKPVYEITKILAQLRYWAEEKGARVFFLDYMQLATSRDAETLYREVSNISSGILEFAKEMNVLTVGLSQLNRETSKNRTGAPFVEGLIGSSSLENDADQVLLLDHSRYAPGIDRTARTYALLAKNRHGGGGQIPIEWDYKTLRVREALPDEEGEWPKRNGRR